MDPISAIASIITIVDSISSIYSAVRDVQGLPKAFDEVAQNLPLVKETLDLAYRQAQLQELNESDKVAISPVIEGCKVKVEALDKIFKEIKQRKDQSQEAKDWSTLSKFYHKIVVPMGKASRVEVLMRNIMDKLKVLAVHQMFKAATQCQTERLQEAIEKLSKVEPSLPDSAFETGNGSINMTIHDQGKGFVNQSGNQENVMGNKFDAKGNMNFAEYHVYGSMSQRNNILEWLESISTPFHFDRKLHDLLEIARKSPGTGDWFLESTELIEWRDGNLRKLWCYGQVGAGKSVLTSIVIDHLQTRRNCYYSGQSIACIYVFFDYREHQKHTLTNIISSLLAQLLRDSQTVTEEVRETFEACSQKRLFLGREEYLQMLEAQARRFRRVYMIIDGLDECSNDVNTNTLNEFLEVCAGFPEKFHILFTSIPGLKSQVLDTDGRIEITAQPEDINVYCGKFIGARPQMQAIVNEGLGADPSFWQSTLNTIIAKSHGVFLLAHLHMQNLAPTQTLQEFEGRLANLSESQAEVYQKALNRISQWPEKQCRKSVSILTWTVFAKRPLTVWETAQALSIEHDFSNNQNILREVSKASLTDETEWNLTSACAGLIVTAPDKEEKFLQLAHHSAEKCLRSSLMAQFQDANSILAKTCLRCLLHTPFKTMDVRPPSTIANNDIREAYPFYFYAANSWGQHLSASVKGDIIQLAWEFLSNKERLECAVRAMDDTKVCRETKVSGMHLAVYFGLVDLIRKVVRKNIPFDINHQTTRGETPLHWAVVHHQPELVRLLVDHRAEVNTQNVDSRTALHLAVINDDSTSASWLLKTERADLEIPDRDGLTPLRIAVTKGKLRTIDMLLRAGAKVNAEGEGGWTALRSAIHQPCNMKMIIKLLIRHGASVSDPTKDGWTLLSWAAQEGREDVITLLIEMGVSLDGADADGKTALRWSIEYSRSMVTWLLIHAKADVNKRDKNGMSPLHAAARVCHRPNGGKDILWLLLDNGADVNAKTRKSEETPLHMVATGGNEPATWLLLNKGADPNQLDFNRRTALHCAVEGGHFEVARLLLWKRPDLVNAVDQEKRSALHYAACQGDEALAEMLVDCQADMNVRDAGGKIPLHIAILQSNENMAVFLIKAGTNLDIPCKKNRVLVPLEELECSEAVMEAIDEAKNNWRPEYRTSSV